MTCPKPKAPRKPRDFSYPMYGESVRIWEFKTPEVSVDVTIIAPRDARKLAAWLLRFAEWAEAKGK